MPRLGAGNPQCTDVVPPVEWRHSQQRLALKGEGPRRQATTTKKTEGVPPDADSQGADGAFCFYRRFCAPALTVPGQAAIKAEAEPDATIDRMELLWMSLASLLAGFVDAIVGGGGLILVPALFAIFPTAHPASLFGLNKSASVWGTAMAATQYSRRVQLHWGALLPAAVAGLAGGFAGAWAVTVVSADFLRKLLPFVLLAVLAYTLAKKELGRHHAPHLSRSAERLAASGIGLALGFYDGFFGPGTGSFFVFLLVRWLGYDFLNASAAAKLLNTATNLAALVLFALKGHVWWHYALALAVTNVAGSLMGTHLALRHGAAFVRVVFIAVVSVLILKTGYDAFLR